MTTPYDIKIAHTAEKQLLALATKQQKALIKLIEALAFNPRPPGSKKIEGMIGLYRQDWESLRLIYKVEEHEILILLIK